MTFEEQIRAILDSRSEAIWAKDIERLISLYSPDIVYFDLVPPLRYVGTAALRMRFLDWFARLDNIGQNIGDVNVSASDDVGIAFMLIEASGTQKGGHQVRYWVRVTNCFRRSGDRWLITHEHVSLPVELESRSAAMDLVP